MSFEAKRSFSIFVLNVMQDACISVRGGGSGGAAAPPVGKKINIIWAKLMYRSGKDTVKNILLFNILIYCFFRGHGNESCNLIGSLPGQYFPISAHGPR